MSNKGVKKELDSETLSIIDKIKKNDKDLIEINLSGKNLGIEGAKLLAQALKTNNNLKELDLADTNIRIEGVKALAETLKNNNSLVIVNFWSRESRQARWTMDGRERLKPEDAPFIFPARDKHEFDGLSNWEHSYEIESFSKLGCGHCWAKEELRQPFVDIRNKVEQNRRAQGLEIPQKPLEGWPNPYTTSTSISSSTSMSKPSKQRM